MLRASLQTIALALVLSVTVAAQTCASGEVLLKNDGLPAVPSGATPVGHVGGVCDSQAMTVGFLQGCLFGGNITPAHGEAIVCVFDTSAWSSVQVTKAAVMASQATGIPGVNFVVNVEFYDSLVPSGSGFVLGTKIFDLGNVTGNNAQIGTHAINTVDVSPYGVVSTGPTLVMVVRMMINLNGTCASATGTSAGFACDLIGPTAPGKNFVHGIDICSGSTLPTLLDMSTVPSGVFVGNWIMRACVVPGTATNPLSVNYVPTSTITSGSTAIVNFDANPSFAGHSYLGVPSLTLAPPGSPLPFPANDPVFSAYLAGDPGITSLFINFAGTMPASGTTTGLINIPPLPPSILPVDLQVAFGTINGGAVTGISPPSALTIQ